MSDRATAGGDTRADDGAAHAAPRHDATGRLLVFGAATLWGTSATLARFVFRDFAVPALAVVELRLFFALAVLLPWLAIRSPRKLLIAPRDLPYFVLLGLLGVATVQGSYYYSISKLGVGLSILIQYLAPALIVLVDAARGRRVRAVTTIALACAIGGTALLVGNVDPIALQARPLHWVVGFSSAIWFATYILLSKRGLAKYPPETVLAYSFTIAFIVWAIVTPPWKILAAGYDAKLWGMFFALGMLSTLLPFILFNAGLRRLAASHAGILATLEPVVAVLSAALFLGEGLRSLQWVGAALVLTAAMLASRDSQHP